MRRFLAAATLGALSCCLTVGGAQAAAGAGAVPLSSFAHIVVDDAHHHVYLTGGAGTDGVVVRSLTGGAVTVVDGESGANGMALSADGHTLYAALTDGSAIAAINTTTLTESARYTTGGGVCPTSVAVLGSNLWFGYGCTGSPDHGIGVVDLSATHPSAATGAETSVNGSLLATSPALPGEVVAGEIGGSGLVEFDVSGTALTQSHFTNSLGGNLADIAITPDGSAVLTASGGEYDIARYSTADLSRLGQYGKQHPYPVAVAVGPKGQVAAGMWAPYDPDVRTYTANGQQIQTFDFDAKNSDVSVANDGLAFDATASRLYVVTDSVSGSGPVQLHVVAQPVTPPTSIKVDGPHSAARGRKLHLSGTITSSGAPVASAHLTVSRHDASGTHKLAGVRSTSTGRFAIADAPPVGGKVSYTVGYAGSSAHRAATKTKNVTVSRAATTLKASLSRNRYSYGQQAVVTAHLGHTFNGRIVSVYARPYRGQRRLLKTAKADKHGNVTAKVRVAARTTFTVHYSGDYRYAPRSASATALVVAKLRSRMAKSAGTNGKYRLYKHSKGAPLAGQVLPNKSGECLKFVLQRNTGSGWHQAATGCFQMNDAGVAVGIAKGSPGVNYRNRVEFRGDKANLGTHSKWYYIQFT